MIDDKMEQDIEDFLAEAIAAPEKDNNPVCRDLQANPNEPVEKEKPTTISVAGATGSSEENLEQNLIGMIVDDYQEVASIINNLKPQLIASKDPGLIDGVSKLLDSNNKKLDLLAKLTLQNKKGRQAREVAEIKNSGKTQNTFTQNNIIVGTREEILKNLKKDGFLESVSSDPTVDVIDKNPRS